MSRVVKRMVIDEISSRLGEVRDLVVLDTSKLDAISDNKLRLELQKKGVTLLAIKNTLARVALKEKGIDVGGEAFAGPSTLVFGGEDIVALSREMSEWAKKIDKISIKGGVVDGQGVGAKAVDEISKGPSRLELIGQIAGLILSPGARLGGALLGPGGKVSGQLKALGDKAEGQEGVKDDGAKEEAGGAA